MVVKMVPDFLDRLDIFVLEIEELEVPQVFITKQNVISNILLFFFSFLLPI